MKRLFALAIIVTVASAQTPEVNKALLAPDETVRLTARIAFLLNATAASISGLVRASEPLKQNIDASAAALKINPRDPAATIQIVRQLRAYLGLADSLPRLAGFPLTAVQQFTELRDDLQRLDLHFDALLAQQQIDARAAAADPFNVKYFAEANSKITPPSETLTRVVFLGDSITDRWRLIDSFPGKDFINRGITGQTTAQVLGRFIADVVAMHPRAVMILAGINDINAGIQPSAIADNLVMLGDVARTHGIQPMFATLLPVSAEVAKQRPVATIKKLNQWIRDYCIRENYIFVDYFTAMADSQGYMRTDLSDDGLNPNAKGYRTLTPIALDAFERLETMIGVADDRRRLVSPKR